MNPNSLGGVSQETLDLLKSNLTAFSKDTPLAKAITTNTGYLEFDLQRPSKTLYPVVTPLRNRIPRVKGAGGKATNWIQTNGITGSGFAFMPWVPEGQRSAQMSQNTTQIAANYVTIGEENGISYEAISAAEGFEDEYSMMQVRLLQQVFIKEEIGLLFGNRDVQLGICPIPVVSASGTGATLPAATYFVKCVALTGEGWMQSSIAAGCPTNKTITGADGLTYVLNGGASQMSAEASVAVTLGLTLFASVAAVSGAVAYAWYVSTATGTEILQAITTINSAAFSAPLLTGTQAVTGFSADFSANNNLAYDGLYTAAVKSGTAIVTNQATGTAGTGTPLTASGRGSVVEIDNILKSMWDSFRLSPSLMLVNSQELKNITTKVLTNASGPLLRYDSDGKSGYSLTASGYVAFYYNPFAAGTGVRIPIMLHPNVPAGTIILHTEDLPAQYISSNVPNVAEVHCRKDYYNIIWPLVTRQRQVGVYAECVLATYAPFALGVLTNIGNG